MKIAKKKIDSIGLKYWRRILFTNVKKSRKTRIKAKYHIQIREKVKNCRGHNLQQYTKNIENDYYYEGQKIDAKLKKR